MNRNMKKWKEQMIAENKKKAMPILSFPGARLIGADVEQLVCSGHLQARCMSSIAEKYDMGLAVSLMDLSVEAEAFGSKVRYSKEEVPTVCAALIHDMQEAQALEIPEIGAARTAECVEGIRQAVQMIQDRPVFAGIIGPYSLAGRLLDMTEIMILCYEEPEMVELVLEKATQFLAAYAKALKEAGADGIVIAEPAAGLLSPSLMEQFSNPYVEKICREVETDDFMIIYHNCGNIIPLMEQVRSLNVTAYSFGNAIDLERALEALPQDRLVLGNIDPAGVLRNGTPEIVKAETMKLLERCAKYPNFIPASGCDIPPKAPFENIDAFFEAVQEFYQN